MAGTRTPGWRNANDSDPGITLLQLMPLLAIPLLATVMVRRWRRRRAG
jgi:hypothetical protein